MKLEQKRTKPTGTPKPNADGGYLPMPWDGTPRPSRAELQEYVARKFLHAAQDPDYAAGWRRPSEATADAVAALIGDAAAGLTNVERQALVIALDVGVQAGQDGRFLTVNLVFDAVAAAFSDNYRAARERGPARVSWEMWDRSPEAPLPSAWRDLVRERIRFEKLVRLAQDGCGLYAAEKKSLSDGYRRYAVDPTEETEQARDHFLAILDDDAATGGTYRRRGSARRLLLADDPDPAGDATDLALDAPGTGEDEPVLKAEVVAGVAFNVATPGVRSRRVIEQLEGARLYLNVAALEAEYDRLLAEMDGLYAEAFDTYGVKLSVSAAKARRRVRDAGTRKMRWGRSVSKWQEHFHEVLKNRRPDAQTEQAIYALAEEFDTAVGRMQQLEPVVAQARAAAKAGRVDEYGDLLIRAKYAKIVNRRYQALTFWPTEVSAKEASAITETVYLGHFEDDEGREHEAEETRTAVPRGLLFRVAAYRAKKDRDAEANAKWREYDHLYPEALEPDTRDLWDRQDLVALDVSGCQFQIYAFLLGLTDLEGKLKNEAWKVIAARRAWERHDDPGDEFTLPPEYARGNAQHDRWLKACLKTGPMTSMYGSPPVKIAQRLEDDPEQYGPGLDRDNLRRFLRDEELQLDQIEDRWKRACARITSRAVWKHDRCAGVSFKDPFDETTVRWNPVGWTLDPSVARAAGRGSVRVYAKVPKAEYYKRVESKKTKKKYSRLDIETPATPNDAGDYPVWLPDLRTAFGPMFIHTLDAMFCGLVIEELGRRGVKDFISIHDSWGVPADALDELHAAVKAASRPWFDALGGVYTDLEQLLGDCTPSQKPKAGGCCVSGAEGIVVGHCARWIRTLRARWKARVEDGDYPVFKVGDPERLSGIPESPPD